MRTCVSFLIYAKESAQKIRKITKDIGLSVVKVAVLNEDFTDFKKNKRVVELFAKIYNETREKINVCEKKIQYIHTGFEIVLLPISNAGRFDEKFQSNFFSDSIVEKSFLLKEELLEKYQSILKNQEKFFSILNSVLDLLSDKERDLLDLKHLNPGEVPFSNEEIAEELDMKRTNFYEFQQKTYAKLHKLIWEFDLIQILHAKSLEFEF